VGKPLAAVLLLASCGYQVDETKVVPAPARADEATAAVAQAFAISYPPAVFWYDPDDCGAGAIHDPEGECVFGFRFDRIVVLSTQRGVPLHETALAHELGHLASLERDGTSDHDHVSRFYLDAWQTPEPGKIPDDQHGLVGEQNRALTARGL